MNAELIRTHEGEYIVDWEIISGVLNGYYRSECSQNMARVSVSNDSVWYNPFSWALPDVETVEVDWEVCREQARFKTDNDLASYRRIFPSYPRDVIQEVRRREIEILHNRERFQSKLKATQERNAEAFATSDQRYGLAIGATRFVRDTSAGALVLGSSFVTLPAGVAFLGVGSALTGYGKFQDTGNVHAGIITGAGTLFLGAFRLNGVKLTGGQEAWLLVAKGTVETASGLAAGDGFGEALQKGATTVIVEGSAKMLFDLKIVKTAFRKMPMPVKITASHELRAARFQNKSLGKEFTAGLSKKIVASSVKQSLSTAGASTVFRYGPMAAACPYPSTERTDLAFVKVE